MASWTIGTESNTVVGAAEVCLVFGVSGDGSQLEISMRELALVSVLASAVLLEWAAHLGFVSVSILDRLGLAAAGGLGASLALASVGPMLANGVLARNSCTIEEDQGRHAGPRLLQGPRGCFVL